MKINWYFELGVLYVTVVIYLFACLVSWRFHSPLWILFPFFVQVSFFVLAMPLVWLENKYTKGKK